MKFFILAFFRNSSHPLKALFFLTPARFQKILLIVSCITTSLAATIPSSSETSSLSSTEANYDGSSLLLKGHVILDHGLGKMMAEEASLQRQETGKEFPFSSIQLKKDVKLALHQNAQILCNEANLDFSILKGTLRSTDEQKVIYTDLISRKKGSTPASLLLSSRLLELNFCKQGPSENKTEYDIETLIAENDVIIEYLGEFQLLAHRAIYRKEIDTPNKDIKKEFQGIITAYPYEEGSLCKLIHQGKEIRSDMMDIDLVRSTLTLLHPSGYLDASLTPAASAIQFKADYLYWDYNKQLITLKGQITVTEEALGTLETQDQLDLFLTPLKDKTPLNKIRTQGFSSLSYQDSSHGNHHLTTYGAIEIDRELMRTTLEKAKSEGSAAEQKQICYTADTFTVFSDSALIDYSLSNNQLVPSLITLKDNIRFSSQDSKEHKRLGCADRLSYSTTTRTFILSANPGEKVLFWDDIQGMHLSAPEVHITLDEATGEQQVKGIGAVQFAFTAEEQNKIQKLFPSIKKPL